MEFRYEEHFEIAGGRPRCRRALARGSGDGSAWELTFQPAGDNGRVFVNVAATNERESARAERVLRSKAALNVSRAGQMSKADVAPADLQDAM